MQYSMTFHLLSECDASAEIMCSSCADVGLQLRSCDRVLFLSLYVFLQKIKPADAANATDELDSSPAPLLHQDPLIFHRDRDATAGGRILQNLSVKDLS